MATQHRTARGIPVDMDRLRLQNETTIAVGNMKVNARGDQLGAGGKVIKTRAQVLAEKNKLHGAMALEDDVFNSPMDTIRDAVDLVQSVPTNLTSPAAADTPVVETSQAKPRGSFAESVAQETTVEQELLEPTTVLNKSTGIKRI